MEGEYLEYNFEPIYQNPTSFEKTLSRLEEIRYIENPRHFYRETAFQKRVDGNYSYYYLFSKIKSNDFNEGSGYLTHGLDFYRGSFHGQMVRGLINYCNLKPNSLILDPFCGCGTTLIEAKLLGFNSIGIDINPIACLNSKVKTMLLEIPFEILFKDNSNYLNLSYFQRAKNFPPIFNTLQKTNIKELFYFFLYTRAVSAHKRFSANLEVSFKRNYNKAYEILKKINEMKKNIFLSSGKTKIYFNNNLSILKKIRDNSIDSIVTSPPYLNLIDYIQEDLPQISQFFNNNDIMKLKIKSIGNKYTSAKKTKENYWKKIQLFIKESYRVLKPKGNIIIVMGDYYNLKKKFISIIEENCYEIERVLDRDVVNLKNKKNKEFVLFSRKNVL